jgi:hypothetical protein
MRHILSVWSSKGECYECIHAFMHLVDDHLVSPHEILHIYVTF